MTDRAGWQNATLVTLLLEPAHRMVGELVERVAAAGFPDIRPSDSRVLENLDPGGTRLTELAARAQMTHQSMGELVSGLEERGYATRIPDPQDRRARLVRLTPQGRDLMHVALEELAAIEGRWLAHFAAAGASDMRAALAGALEREQQSHPAAEAADD
ncbi:MAG: MarR family transcriptional regulator [Thermomicrobiales bacterium]